MAEFQTGLPSIRLLQTAIREKRDIELELTTGKAVVGKIQWQDPDTVCVVETTGQTVVIWRQAIAALRFRA